MAELRNGVALSLFSSALYCCRDMGAFTCVGLSEDRWPDCTQVGGRWEPPSPPRPRHCPSMWAFHVQRFYFTPKGQFLPTLSPGLDAGCVTMGK